MVQLEGVINYNTTALGCAKSQRQEAEKGNRKEDITYVPHYGPVPNVGHGGTLVSRLPLKCATCMNARRIT